MKRLPLVLALLALAGCVNAPEAPDAESATRESTDAMDVRDLAYNFSGTIEIATPATPAAQDFPFDVPKGAIAVSATLRWPGQASTLTLALVDPRGDVAETGFTEKPGQRSAATVEPPASGTWNARVGSMRAMNEPFTVDVGVQLIQPRDNVLADEIPMAPAAFAELNLIMEKDAIFNWSFESSAGPVAWDIHSHENGRTITHEEGTDARHQGTFKAPKRQIYSILFQNTGPETTVTYRVEGQFRVHSHSQ